MHNTWKLWLRQMLVACCAFLISLSCGLTFGFSAILLPQLSQETSKIKIGPDESSWIASSAALPMGLGSIISGYSMEQYGRRATELLVCAIFALGWVSISLANNLWMIYIGRVITGVCVGLSGPLNSVYISETTDPKLRGTAVAGVHLSIACGIWFSHSVGSLLDWKLAAALCSVFPFVGYVTLFLAPESPVWLASKGKLAKAEETFRWLRGYSEAATKEMMVILNKKKSVSFSSTSKFNMETVRRILDPLFLKPFFIITMFTFLQQISGFNVVIFYSFSIVSKVSTDISEYLSTFIIDMIRVIMSVMTCILLTKVPRRVMAVGSAFGTAVTLFLLAFVTKYLPSEYSWASLLALVLYICIISLGIVPLPWTMMGEIYPSRFRELGTGVSACFGFFFFFCVVKTSPFLISTWGIEGAFTIYGTISFLGAIFLYFYLPETMNKTLDEIEDGFKSKPQCQENEVGST